MSDVATLARSAGYAHFEVSYRGQNERIHDAAENLKAKVFVEENLCAVNDSNIAATAGSSFRHPTRDRIAIVAYDPQGQPIGAVQLMCALVDAAAPVPMATRYDLADVFTKYPVNAIAEISGLAVLKAVRGLGMAWLFFDEIIDVAKRSGIRACVIAADACTDEISDAHLAFLVARAQRLASDRLTITPRNTAPGDNTPQKLLYTRANYVQALKNDWQYLTLPGKPALYARRGARFVGEPTWEPTYHTCSLPMTLFLD